VGSILFVAGQHRTSRCYVDIWAFSVGLVVVCNHQTWWDVGGFFLFLAGPDRTSRCHVDIWTFSVVGIWREGVFFLQ
jgi:1-acyl-sn-glycerol-3-phosphate acyltransferase